MKKIGIFVDVQNIYYTVKQVFNTHFNYKAFWQTIAKQGDIVIANAYAIERPDTKQKKFQQALTQIGFNVKLKPYIQRADGSAKGDWDVGITIDILKSAPELDRVILLSGDGDFDMLLETIIQDHGIQAHVYGTPGLTAESLKNAASLFTPIDTPLLMPNQP